MIDTNTNNYKIVVAKSAFEQTDKELYHIVNKDTGVTETEFEAIPRAIQAMHLLQEEYDEVAALLAEGKTFNRAMLNPFAQAIDGDDIPLPGEEPLDAVDFNCDTSVAH